ncbi:uncharacterized protein LOC126845673 isoform X2 [Adelges cooleyi]|uniref:uncharacterized protein LOC126845673 isoform X2 n=1 Tax=Adelges cooleyi TaxID=133065 RepID=UPI0021801548|nr:uncharacterized protein LOC126845673 isoform X2 [Adelges cooleyi]
MYKIICISSALIILCLTIFGSGLEIENDIKEFDLNAITMIVTDDDEDYTVDFLKQNVNITEETRPLLDLIEKKDDTTLNIYEVLDLYTKNDQIQEKVSIGQVQNIIRQGFGCAVSTVTSLYLFVLLHDLKKLKIDLESQKENAKKEEGEEVAVREEHFLLKVYSEKESSDLLEITPDGPNYDVTEYNRLGERFLIKSNTNLDDAGPSNQINKPFTHPILVYFLYYSEYLWAGILRKQVIYQINYAVQFEMFKVIFGPGNSDSLMTDDHITDVLCVLEEILKMVDDEISSQCVDHKGSLVKKYEIFNKALEKKFKMYLFDLDIGKEEDLSQFHLQEMVDPLTQLVELYGEGKLNSVEPPIVDLNFPNCSQRYTPSTNDEVVARLRQLYTENDKLTDATTGKKNVRMEPTETN